MKKILFIFLFLNLGLCYSQNKHLLNAKIKRTSSANLIRFSYPDRAQFDHLMKNGITITRFEIVNSETVNPVIINKSFKHYAEDDTLNWKQLLEKDTNKVGFVYNALFTDFKKHAAKNPESRKYEKMIFDMLMLSCDFDQDIARACGAFYADSSADVSKTYMYRFSTLNAAGVSVPLLQMQSSSDISIAKEIANLEGNSKAQVANLSWNAAIFVGLYGAFIIERSSDNKSFMRINLSPLVLIKTAYEVNKEKIFYTDTMPAKDGSFYYRIKGIDYFGELSAPSNVIELKCHQAFTAIPLIDSLTVSHNRDVILHWNLNDLSQKKLVKKYVVESSQFVDKKFMSVYQGIECRYTDQSLSSSRYYRVGAVTAYDDTVYSHSRLAIITDTLPPPFPKSLKGVVDAKGNLMLTWNRVNEAELKGYKIYKANSTAEEFVQINNHFISDTVFREKINLKTLSKKIYYAVVAVDQNFNSSPMSPYCMVKRPDTIAPAKPILFSVAAKQQTARLRIIPSLSDDVEQHLVYRRKDSVFQLAGTFNSRDSVYYFYDTLSDFIGSVEYKVTAIDDSWNASDSQILTCHFEEGFRSKIQQVEFEVDRREKHIRLSWSYPLSNINRFVIYRSSASEPLTIIKTLSSDKHFYTDRNLNIGNAYEYRIKAVFEDDLESLISDAIKIIY